MAGELDFAHLFVPGASGRTLLLLHGTGGDENDLLSLGRAIDPEAALLGVRGRVLENGMPRFFRRLAEGAFDEADIRRRAAELAAFVEDAATRYAFDRVRMTAVGFSNGANIAAAVLLLHPSVLREAILIRPMYPLTPDTPPDLSGARVLIEAGSHDPMGTPQQIRMLADALRNAGADVTIVRQPAGHELTNGDVEEAKTWLRSRLSDGAGKNTGIAAPKPNIS